MSETGGRRHRRSSGGHGCRIQFAVRHSYRNAESALCVEFRASRPGARYRRGQLAAAETDRHAARTEAALHRRFSDRRRSAADRLRGSGGAERGSCRHRTGTGPQRSPKDRRFRKAASRRWCTKDSARKCRNTCSATRRRWPSASNPTTTKRVLRRSSSAVPPDSRVPETSCAAQSRSANDTVRGRVDEPASRCRRQKLNPNRRSAPTQPRRYRAFAHRRAMLDDR